MIRDPFLKEKNMLVMHEEEILRKLRDVEFDLSIVRAKLKIAKSELNSLETDLIGLRLSQEKLTENLRHMRSTSISKKFYK